MYLRTKIELGSCYSCDRDEMIRSFSWDRCIMFRILGAGL